jgi:hypothetical protein
METTHVIHDLGTASDGGASCLGLVGIDREKGVWLDPENPFDYRNNSLDLLLNSDICFLTAAGDRDPGPGGLTTEVDDVCALSE